MKKIIYILLLCFFSCVKVNAITGIKLNNGELIPHFDKNTTHYNVYVEENIDKINLECIKEETDVKIEYNENIILKDGENIEKITVTDNLNNEKVYVLNIQRGLFTEDKSNAYLKELNIKDYEINFEFDKYNYEVTIDENVDELIIDYKPFNLNAYTLQTGGLNLDKSQNIIAIKVVSEDKKFTNTYKIIVNKTITTFKEEKKDETNIFGKTELTKKEKVMTFSIICFIALLITISVYLLLFKRKKR